MPLPALLPEADAVRRLLLQMLPRLLLPETDALPQPVLQVHVRRLLCEANAMSLSAAVMRTVRPVPTVGALPVVRTVSAARAAG